MRLPHLLTEVSIHAPTRGATLIHLMDIIYQIVSIHAPTRGATTSIEMELERSLWFQSTHPHGVRPTISALRLLHNVVVSIHAPTRGATYHPYILSVLRYCFNPRTHTGCDYRPLPTRPRGWRFQSTHPHGVRRKQAATMCLRHMVSIHAPTRGATKIYYAGTGLQLLFQSTHPHGVRLILIGCLASLMGFNPRTHTGCDKFKKSS